MEQIQALLNAAKEEGSDNVLTLDDAKHWILGYLEMHEEDAARFPKGANLAHWDILVADYDHSRQGVFLAAFFSGESATFIAGRGSIPELRDFGDNSFPNDPNDIPDAVSQRFSVSGTTTITRSDLLGWLNGQ